MIDVSFRNMENYKMKYVDALAGLKNTVKKSKKELGMEEIVALKSFFGKDFDKIKNLKIDFLEEFVNVLNKFYSERKDADADTSELIKKEVYEFYFRESKFLKELFKSNLNEEKIFSNLKRTKEINNIKEKYSYLIQNFATDFVHLDNEMQDLTAERKKIVVGLYEPKQNENDGLLNFFISLSDDVSKRYELEY